MAGKRHVITGIIWVYKKEWWLAEGSQRHFWEQKTLPLGLETQVGVVQSDRKVQRKWEHSMKRARPGKTRVIKQQAECGEGVGSWGLVVGGAERSRNLTSWRQAGAFRATRWMLVFCPRAWGSTKGFQQGPRDHSVQDERRWDLPWKNGNCEGQNHECR